MRGSVTDDEQLCDIRRAAGGIPELIALPGTGEPQAYTTRGKWQTLRSKSP